MGRKSREKRGRAKKEIIIERPWYQSDWFGALVVGIIFFGGVVCLDMWGKNMMESIDRDGRNAYQTMQEANRRYVEKLFD